MKTIGIIRETKSEFERRAPITPQDMAELVKKYEVRFIVQPSPNRIFRESEYEQAGALISEDLSGCDIILGIKEVKIEDLVPEKTFLFFSHTIKGQEYNMAMLQKILDYKITLIDYEKIEDTNGRRLIFFSYQAGLAGAIDTFWAVGQRLLVQGIDNPFKTLQQTRHYSGLKEAEAAFAEVAGNINKNGLPAEICPFTVGVAGYGNVSAGAQHIIDLLPVQEINPEDFLRLRKSGNYSNKVIYKTIFKEEHLVKPKSDSNTFELQDYYDHPEKYSSTFNQHLKEMSVFINAVFWDARYPRLVTNKFLKDNPSLRMIAIGDISCDIKGGVESTLVATEPGNPVYVFDPNTEKMAYGFEGPGIQMMTVDILPSELPLESSVYFSFVLKTLLPGLIEGNLNTLDVSNEMKGATIVFKGKLTQNFKYIEKYLT